MNGYTTPLNTQSPNCCGNQPYSGMNTVMPTYQTAVPPVQSAGIARYGRPTTEPVVNPAITAQLVALSSNLSPITPLTEPQALTLQSTQYFNGFLRTQIGKKVTVDFLIGTNTLVDKTGTLLGVGANYILINEIETDDLLICDFYTIKFVKVYY